MVSPASYLAYGILGCSPFWVTIIAEYINLSTGATFFLYALIAFVFAVYVWTNGKEADHIGVLIAFMAAGSSLFSLAYFKTLTRDELLIYFLLFANGVWSLYLWYKYASKNANWSDKFK